MNPLLIIAGAVLLLSFPVGMLVVVAHEDGVKAALALIGVTLAVTTVMVGGALLISAGMGAL